jgi:hypothetical protein
MSHSKSNDHNEWRKQNARWIILRRLLYSGRSGRLRLDELKRQRAVAITARPLSHYCGTKKVFYLADAAFSPVESWPILWHARSLVAPKGSVTYRKLIEYGGSVFSSKLAPHNRKLMATTRSTALIEGCSPLP